MRAAAAIARLVLIEIFRKKDFYVALILIGVLLAYASGLKFYNVDNVVRYLLELGLALVFLFSVVLTVSIAARQYPSEKEGRTLLTLLAKPVGRLDYVAGKFLGALAAGSAAFAVFFAVFLVAAAAKGASLSPAVVAQAAYLFLLNLCVVAALTSGLSYYLTTAANVSITLVLYVMIHAYGPGLKHAAGDMPALSRFALNGIYYGLPHFEFFDIRQRLIHEWGGVSAGLMLLLTGYALAYTLAFLALGWARFSRERF